jgi:hypothetical protein
MFRMSPSELKIRTYLALGFVLVGLLVARAKAAGQPYNLPRTGPEEATAISYRAGSSEKPKILATDPKQFKIASGQYQVVEFFAPWDPISQDSAHLMNTFEEKYRGLVTFSYLDVSDPENRDDLDALNVLFYPQFALLDGAGNVLQQWTTPSAGEMEMAIAKAGLPMPRW